MNPRITEWVRNCHILSNPSCWCSTQYNTQAKAHHNTCPVLWACGHLLDQHSTLRPAGQVKQLLGMTTVIGEDELLRAAKELETFSGLIGPIGSSFASQASTATTGQERPKDPTMEVAVAPNRKEGQDSQDVPTLKVQERGTDRAKAAAPDNSTQWWRGSTPSELKGVMRAMGRLLTHQEDNAWSIVPSLYLLQIEDTAHVTYVASAGVSDTEPSCRPVPSKLSRCMGTSGAEPRYEGHAAPCCPADCKVH